MNRRHLLQAMLSVPIAGALGGCRHEHKDHPPFPPSRGGTLKVVLQGPFAVVIDTKNHYRIKAFVPYSDNNEHEFLFPGRSDHGNKFREAGNKFQFVLEEDNLERNERMPHIDAGFDDFTLKVRGWEPSPNDHHYFVALDLPAPELITYRNEPTQLGLMVDNKSETGKKLVVLRTSHVLQYRVHDFDELKKVKVRSHQLGENHPFSCTDISTWLQERATVPDQGQGTVPDQERGRRAARARMERMKTESQCSNDPVSWLFFGVGLPYPQREDDAHVPQHGLDFFNKKLLGAFPTAVDKEQHRLVDANVQVCGTGAGGNSMFVAAAQRYPMPQPRLVPVTSLTDCRASGLNAINS